MRLQYLLPLLLFMVLLIFFWVGLGRDPNLLPSMLVNKPLPSLVIPTIDQQRFVLDKSQLNAKITVLNVWATWSAACAIEQPFLVELTKQAQVQLIGLNYKDNLQAAKNYLQKNGNPYQTVLLDADGKYAIQLGIYGTPETFLIDKKGMVRYRYVGPITLEVLEKDLLPKIFAMQGEG